MIPMVFEEKHQQLDIYIYIIHNLHIFYIYLYLSIEPDREHKYTYKRYVKHVWEQETPELYNCSFEN